jgi:hypothetical protein
MNVFCTTRERKKERKKEGTGNQAEQVYMSRRAFFLFRSGELVVELR